MSGPAFVVLSSALQSNALGRALTIAEVASRLGPTEVWAFGRGDVWSGASQWTLPVTPFQKASQVLAAVRSRAERGNVVVWSSKSFPPLGTILESASRMKNVVTIADFDDDDLGLIGEHRAVSLRNRLVLNSFRQNGAARVRRSQAVAKEVSDVVTVASWAVGRRLGIENSRRIVHAREPHPPRPHRPAGSTRVGFLGTIRPHKGIQHLVDMVEASSGLRGVSFRQSGWEVPDNVRAQWIELDPTTSLVEAYRQVDVVLAPSDGRSKAAQVQLPAKVIDAAAASVPLLATPTDAVAEVMRDAYVPVEDWSPARVLPLLENERLMTAVSARALDLMRSTLSIDANARALESVLAQTLSRTGEL